MKFIIELSVVFYDDDNDQDHGPTMTWDPLSTAVLRLCLRANMWCFFEFGPFSFMNQALFVMLLVL